MTTLLTDAAPALRLARMVMRSPANFATCCDDAIAVLAQSGDKNDAALVRAYDTRGIGADYVRQVLRDPQMFETLTFRRKFSFAGAALIVSALAVAVLVFAILFNPAGLAQLLGATQ